MDVSIINETITAWEAERERTRNRRYEISFRLFEFADLFRGSAVIANMLLGDALKLISNSVSRMDKRDISRSVITIFVNEETRNELITQFAWANKKNHMIGFEMWEIVPLKSKKGNKRKKVSVI
jgi:hypothetical protein